MDFCSFLRRVCFYVNSCISFSAYGVYWRACFLSSVNSVKNLFQTFGLLILLHFFPIPTSYRQPFCFFLFYFQIHKFFQEIYGYLNHVGQPRKPIGVQSYDIPHLKNTWLIDFIFLFHFNLLIIRLSIISVLDVTSHVQKVCCHTYSA
jgi:hypothetical protein